MLEPAAPKLAGLVKSVLEPNYVLRLAVCVFGIVSSLLVYGVLQERIMTQARPAAEAGL